MAFKNIQTSPIGISRQERTVNLYVLIVQSWDGCSTSLLVGIYRYIYISERSALSGAFLHCFILFVFCFYICIAFLLIFVPLKEYYSASTPPLPQRQFPKFQFSKVPIFKKNQRNQKNKKNNCARTLPHPLFPPWSVQNWFFWFLWFFWKIGILDVFISWDVLNFQFPWK